MTILALPLTNRGSRCTFGVRVTKRRAGIGTLSVARRSLTAPQLRGFSMVGRFGPRKRTVPSSGSSNPIRLAARNWNFSGQVLKPVARSTAMSEQTNTLTQISSTDINISVNCVPRIQDLRLAEALGFNRPRKIRDLVSKHTEALEKFGEIICTATGQNTRGRPGKEYWLNEKQALYLCTKSEAEHAIELTIQMVEVFYQVRRGQLVTSDFDPAVYVAKARSFGIEVVEHNDGYTAWIDPDNRLKDFYKTAEHQAFRANTAALKAYLEQQRKHAALQSELAELEARKREITKLLDGKGRA